MHVPLTYAVSIFLLWLGLSSQAWAKRAELPTTVFVYGSEAVFDFRLNHTLAVVQAALNIGAEKQAPIEVRSTAERELGMNRNRALASIQQNKGDVHIISSSASRDLDAMLMPITTPRSFLWEQQPIACCWDLHGR